MKDQQHFQYHKSDTLAPATIYPPDTSAPTNAEDLDRDRPIVSGGEDIKNGKENNKTSGACEAGVPLRTNATKMYWRGTPEAGRGVLVQHSKEKNEDHQRGVTRQKQSVARQFVTRRTITMVFHPVSKAWHASPRVHLGVLLEDQGVACQAYRPHN
ncbi:hypothetical protein AHAS_Ahas09G0148800 [Arachis hypogaea]